MAQKLVGNNKCSLSLANGFELLGNNKCSLSLANGLELVGDNKFSLSLANSLAWRTLLSQKARLKDHLLLPTKEHLLLPTDFQIAYEFTC